MVGVLAVSTAFVSTSLLVARQLTQRWLALVVGGLPALFSWALIQTVDGTSDYSLVGPLAAWLAAMLFCAIASIGGFAQPNLNPLKRRPTMRPAGLANDACPRRQSSETIDPTAC
ncbi:hypothetical protein ACFL5O_03700 [Myxococcota bacterium]